MPDQSLTSRRQPKLRSSCDGCGMAKLRCDRAQPECGRCVSYGLPCIYGISRRMGKAPGGSRRTSVTQGTSAKQSGVTETNNRESKNHRSNNNADRDAIMMDLSLLSNLADIPASFELGDGNANTLFSSYLDGSSLLDTTSFDLDTKLGTEDLSNDIIPFDFQAGLVCTQESPELGDYSSTNASTTQPITIEAESLIKKSESDRSLDLPSSVASHRCYMDAYEILCTLSQLKISDSHNTTMDNTIFLPFDHLLRTNREISERLGSLLDCSCARSSHLTLLHASIICRVLTLYQQAAACRQGNGISNPRPMVLDSSSHELSPMRSPPELLSASWGTGPSTAWSGTAAGASTILSDSTRSTPSTRVRSSTITVAPPKMAVGVFNVDDQRVQTAVNIQLVLGEMRRTERLIDQFTSRGFIASQQPGNDECTYGGAIDNLCRSLDSWLRAEHSRIVNILRSQLSKLNT